MFLKLIESRRARVMAGWALVASLGAHAATVGGWVQSERHGSGSGGSAEGPISIRYLLPPDQIATAPGEHIDWVAVGAPATGWVTGGAPTPATDRRAGNDPPPEAVTRDVESPNASEIVDQTRIFTADDVDSAATRDPTSDGPRYPDELRTHGVQGEVLVEFAVDTTGRADSTTFTVVESTHPLFTAAVRDALPRMHFTPAVSRGHRVRQLVRLPMKFRLVTTPSDQQASI